MIKQVPINTVISNEVLLQAFPDTAIDGLTVCNHLRIEVKIVAFTRIEFTDIDEHNLVDPYIYQQNGQLWLLKLQVNNLGTEEVTSYDLGSTIAIMDHDGYIFPSIFDDHITHNSKFSIQSGLYDTYWKSYPIRVESSCMLLFYLPDEEEQEYYLYHKGGYFDDI